MRLAKMIGGAGHCSRRQASRLIADGRVSVNGDIAHHLTFVDHEDKISIDGEVINVFNEKYYVVYHKPVGIDCNLNVSDPDSLLHLIPQSFPRLFPIGRLDKDSCGLLLLTNDGELANRLLQPQFKQTKCYEVCVEPSFSNRTNNNIALSDDFESQMNQPIMIRGKLTTVCEITLIDDLRFTITLTQGLNRQIRKMCSHLGFNVTHLKRLSMANIALGSLLSGEWRVVSHNELRNLKDLLGVA